MKIFATCDWCRKSCWTFKAIAVDKWFYHRACFRDLLEMLAKKMGKEQCT